MNNQYSIIAKYYKLLNVNYDYNKLIEFTNIKLKEYKIIPPSIVVDLGCGTGELTVKLLEEGYDPIGIDLSIEMLNQAIKLEEDTTKKIGGILWLNSDMRNLDLFGTVSAILCYNDCINYLNNIDELNKVFKKIHTFLDNNGIFIFDVNTPYRYEKIYGCNNVIIENKNIYLGWQNYYNSNDMSCEFILDIFTKKNNLWERSSEYHKQKCFTYENITNALNQNNFKILNTFGDLDSSMVTNNCEKWYFICKKEI